jgi:hypothetical protein
LNSHLDLGTKDKGAFGGCQLHKNTIGAWNSFAQRAKEAGLGSTLSGTIDFWGIIFHSNLWAEEMKLFLQLTGKKKG